MGRCIHEKHCNTQIHTPLYNILRCSTSWFGFHPAYKYFVDNDSQEDIVPHLLRKWTKGTDSLGFAQLKKSWIHLTFQFSISQMLNAMHDILRKQVKVKPNSIIATNCAIIIE